MTKFLTFLVIIVLVGGALLYRSLERGPEPTAEPEPAPAAVEEVPPPPPYEVLDQVDLMGGGRHADVLVPSLSKESSPDERESAAWLIKNKEGLKSIALYCSKEAMQADYSESFAREHPDARDCVLGSISEKGKPSFE